ncbi:MAG TPA: WXG100 family type VII secretion target [Actinocrinis sp.]|jgi:WXG100 family type VII secretion target|uniref:WXG100 family type VII secretion target n=1 Tax=Actinocrinis sp. TaxID=1920516 RepID=UPI002DDCDF2B|nr:WXG100 family type VII secretion target [Actinocrinis sp.]HEV3174035.1 WXG100 family type VII secretion target [Actinocrinis sp.]
MGVGSNGGILVQFAAIAEASQNVNRTYTNLDQKLNDLRQMLAPIAAEWTGKAAENYQEKQRAWDQAQQDLGMVLQQIAKVLEAAHDSYNQTEQANANSWT